MQKKFGFDLDGVVIDHSHNIVEVAGTMGVTLSLTDTPIDILREKVDRGIYRRINSLVFDDPKILSTAPVFPGVCAGLDKLEKSGQSYYLISRQKNPALAINNLINKGLWPRYFDENNSFFPEEISGKKETALKLGVDVYMDDQVRVLSEMQVSEKFLFDPLGNYQKNTLDYKVVSSWFEFIKIIGY